jgi:hypothetical protein
MKNLYIVVFVTMILSACGGGVSFNDADIGGSGVSQGGSLSRFTIVGDYLYIVNDFSLIPIDISDLENPIKRETRDLGVGIETIFPYNDLLFIGSSSAVYIYDIADPANPRYLSDHSHATGCDPVVVSGNYAYVTLREGVSCGSFFDINVLEVLDVSNVRNPILINTIDMTSPRGLALGCNNKLFVCEGAGGIVQFDLTDPSFPVYETTYAQFPAEDLIIRDELVIATGTEGVYQYSCASDSLVLLSYIPFSL